MGRRETDRVCLGGNEPEGQTDKETQCSFWKWLLEKQNLCSLGWAVEIIIKHHLKWKCDFYSEGIERNLSWRVGQFSFH